MCARDQILSYICNSFLFEFTNKSEMILLQFIIDILNQINSWSPINTLKTIQFWDSWVMEAKPSKFIFYLVSIWPHINNKCMQSKSINLDSPNFNHSKNKSNFYPNSNIKIWSILLNGRVMLESNFKENKKNSDLSLSFNMPLEANSLIS